MAVVIDVWVLCLRSSKKEATFHFKDASIPSSSWEHVWRNNWGCPWVWRIQLLDPCCTNCCKTVSWCYGIWFRTEDVRMWWGHQWHTLLTAWMPLFCSFHIPMSSVIYYWTDTRWHWIYLLNGCMQEVARHSRGYRLNSDASLFNNLPCVLITWKMHTNHELRVLMNTVHFPTSFPEWR